MDGFDILYFGTFDYSSSLGAPGDVGSPEIIKTAEKLARIARDAGKAASISCGLAAMQRYIDMGYNMLAIFRDVDNLGDAWLNVHSQFKEVADKNKK